MDDYIAKPVRLPDLEKTLGRWLRRDTAAGAPAVEEPKTPEAPAETAPVDHEVLDSFREAGQGRARGFLAELIDQFLREAPERIDRVRQAVDRIDAEALRMAAHSLKGSSSTIGAAGLASICASIEAQARDGSIDRGASVLLDRLDHEFCRVREALEAELR